MRVAQVAPLCESVPPAGYGGIERVVSWLTEALVAHGHDVTLYASGDSSTSARLVPACDVAIWHDERARDVLPHHLQMMEMVFADADRYDVIHFHTSDVQFPFLRRRALPHVTTAHNALDGLDARVLLDAYPEMPLVSISMNQRVPVPHASWVSNIPHGMPADLHTPGDGGGGYLAFLGRIAPEKGLERAVEITRRAGARLVISSRTNPADRAYHARVIDPMLAGAAAYTEMIGETGGDAKNRFLGQAHALLFPIGWEEPFGLVMIEAMACGTPVIAWRRGSVPEVIEDGITGFIVDDIDQAAAAVRKCGDLDRDRIRRRFTERFDAARMAEEYIAVYEAQIAATGRKLREETPRRGVVIPMRSALP
jgi:glycosyltransferase involved in cell wall biosynthesis